MIPIYHADDRSTLFSRLGKRICVSPGICDQVRKIVADVRQGGDAAVLRCAEEVDGVRRAADQMIVDPQRMKKTGARADPEVLRSWKRRSSTSTRITSDSFSNPGSIRDEVSCWASESGRSIAWVSMCRGDRVVALLRF